MEEFVILDDIGLTLKDKFGINTDKKFDSFTQNSLKLIIGKLKKDGISVKIINKGKIINWFKNINESRQITINNKLIRVDKKEFIVSIDSSMKGDINLEVCRLITKSLRKGIISNRPNSPKLRIQFKNMLKSKRYLLADEVSFSGETLLSVRKKIVDLSGAEIEGIIIGVINSEAYDRLIKKFSYVNYLYKLNLTSGDYFQCARNIIGIDGKALKNGKIVPLWSRQNKILWRYNSDLKKIWETSNKWLKSKEIIIVWESGLSP
ncbi:MAG: hypothetical protein KGH54_00920 [Candidatus Micrarchaeota archaeon]|nr:hypothetical protein [Candidatus Micrarchaeota archaeon]